MIFRCLIVVVGLFGVGKDSIMEGLIIWNLLWYWLWWVIMCVFELGGEDYEFVSEVEFV